MKKKSIINLSDDKKAYLISEIKAYFQNERDLDLGDLAAGLVLDFFTEKLGPEIYNQGVADSYKYMNEKIEDLLGLQQF